MSESPETIRANIESTRRELGLDVDALADKVTPSKIVHRQTDKVRGVFSSVRERVMGAADDAGSTLQGVGSSGAQSVSDTAHRVAAKAEGNPLAVGLMAFGAGLLLASLIPASDREKQAAEAVKDAAQPLVDEATSVAKEMGERLQEPAQEAVDAVKDAAGDAIAHVKDDASGAVEAVKERGTEAKDQISDNR